MKERIQKIIAERGVCSRRAAEKLIEEGRVRVNGHPVVIGAKCEPDALITIDRERIADSADKQVYILLHKPRGYVTTASDEQDRKTVMQLLPDIKTRVYPVGRLDMASEGLLLLTNDGELAKFLTHPSSMVPKEYLVTVLGYKEDVLEKLAAGVTLDDGFTTAPATVRLVRQFDDKTVLSVTITQGHNRQVRRMCEALGLTVRRLVRVAEGELKLGTLPLGKTRFATPAEERYLKSLTAPTE